MNQEIENQQSGLRQTTSDTSLQIIQYLKDDIKMVKIGGTMFFTKTPFLFIDKAVNARAWAYADGRKMPIPDGEYVFKKNHMIVIEDGEVTTGVGLAYTLDEIFDEKNWRAIEWQS